MKTLLLVRHAKSSWGDPSLPDRERPLNERGKRDAPRMGKRLADLGVRPDVVLSSPARRAFKTARILAGELGCKAEDIRVDARLYASEPDVLLQVIRELGDGKKCVMLVGHNPELTELAHRLSARITHLPTCAVALFAFDAKSWSGTGNEEPAKVVLYTPGQS
jgi:phosphohistidine phosphatase